MSDIFQGAEEALGEATGQFASKIRGRAKDFFGTSAQAEQALYRKRELTGDMFRKTIRTFGMQNLTKGDQFFETSINDIQQQLKAARDEAIRARHAGNLDSYQRAQQRTMELKEMLIAVQNAKDSRLGTILTAVGIAVASVLGAKLFKLINAPSGALGGVVGGVGTFAT